MDSLLNKKECICLGIQIRSYKFGLVAAISSPMNTIGGHAAFELGIFSVLLKMLIRFVNIY